MTQTYMKESLWLIFQQYDQPLGIFKRKCSPMLMNEFPLLTRIWTVRECMTNSPISLPPPKITMQQSSSASTNKKGHNFNTVGVCTLQMSCIIQNLIPTAISNHTSITRWPCFPQITAIKFNFHNLIEHKPFLTLLLTYSLPPELGTHRLNTTTYPYFFNSLKLIMRKSP